MKLVLTLSGEYASPPTRLSSLVVPVELRLGVPVPLVAGITVDMRITNNNKDGNEGHREVFASLNDRKNFSPYQQNPHHASITSLVVGGARTGSARAIGGRHGSSGGGGGGGCGRSSDGGGGVWPGVEHVQARHVRAPVEHGLAL